MDIEYLIFNVKKRAAHAAVRSGGFTIVEVVVSLLIIGIICSTVMLIIKHDMVAMGQGRLKMQAFETARENMETLLTASSVSEMDDFGVSDQNPNIQWETLVESFSDPNGKMWVRAVCSATYPDANDQPKTLELTHWLTDVPQSVTDKIKKDKEKLKDMNEPNSLPTDANEFGQPASGQTNTNPGNTLTDPELKKVMDQLLKK